MDNISSDPASGEKELDALFGGNTQDDAAAPAAGANAPNEVSNDIDKIFGSEASDDGNSGGGTLGDNASTGTSDEMQPDISGMSPEQLARKFQSDYDRAKAQLDAASKKLKDYESVEGFVNSLYEDPEVRHAFIAELEPDLIKPKDPYDVLQERLSKEFGTEFVPDDEEAKRPFSPSWKWYKRVDDLTKELTEKGKKSTPQSLKGIREERLRQKQEAEQRAQDEKQKIVTTMKWDSNRYNHFANWVSKLSGLDVAKMYSYVMARSSANPPSLAGQAAAPSHLSNDIKSELDKFFGK